MAGYVLDTSAVVALLYREEGATQVRDLFASALPIYVPFMTMMETQYKILRDRRDLFDEYMATIETWPIHVIESTPEWCERAARVKAPGGLSLGDAWVASLALIEDAILVHKDPEFAGVADLKAMPLPYKPRTTRK